MGVQSSEVDSVAAQCRPCLGDSAKEQELYHSLPLAILDAVFSINAKYTSTAAVVKRYADYKGISLWRMAWRHRPQPSRFRYPHFLPTTTHWAWTA